jgi:hypothetical protein
MSPPYGTDRAVVYASEVPLGEVAMSQIGQGLRAYDGDQKSLAVLTCGIFVVSRRAENKRVPIVSFYEATYEITASRE